jgi:hypothetical protein
VKLQRPLVLDAGALIDVERRSRGETYRACLDARRDGVGAWLPAVVWGQVWRGKRSQAPLSQVLNLCRVLPFTKEMGDDVGQLLALTRTSDVVDAAVVVTAFQLGGVVLTSDPDDIARLADAFDSPITIVRV